MTAQSRADVLTKPTPPRAGWLVVAQQELRDLWLSARGPSIVLGFSLLLSFLTYLAASNKDQNIVDLKDTVNLIAQMTLGIGVAASLLVSADSISGERERETLESLLLTPVSRRHIAVGKLLAAISMWPVLMVVAVPYVWVLARTVGLAREALVVAFLLGTLLTLAFASLGLIVSIFSNSNRLSLAISFFVFVASVAPTQLTFKGWVGGLINRMNPVSAAAEYMKRVLVRGHPFRQDLDWLWSPAAAAFLGVALVILIAGQLHLRGGIRQ